MVRRCGMRTRLVLRISLWGLKDAVSVQNKGATEAATAMVSRLYTE
jgi:hypothetical protein